MPLDYLSELKESCAIAKSRSLTVTRATKITEWKSALTYSSPFKSMLHTLREQWIAEEAMLCLRELFYS